VVAALSGLAAVAGADPLHGHRGPLGAFGRHHGPMGPLGMRFLAAAERLDLSDAQRTQLKQIRRKAPREVMPKVQSLMEARMELQDLLAEDKTDKTGLRRAHQKVLDAQAALHSAMFNLRMEVRDVLTPEQRSELRQGMRRRGGERPGPGPRGGFEPDWDPDEEQEF
jgi:Spy/CpxP family protein refolding chaperone